MLRQDLRRRQLLTRRTRTRRGRAGAWLTIAATHASAHTPANDMKSTLASPGNSVHSTVLAIRRSSVATASCGATIEMPRRRKRPSRGHRSRGRALRAPQRAYAKTAAPSGGASDQQSRACGWCGSVALSAESRTPAIEPATDREAEPARQRAERRDAARFPAAESPAVE